MADLLDLQPKNFAKCNHCAYKIEFRPLNIPIIGRASDKAAEVMEKMGKHLYAKHAEVFAQGVELVGDFQSFLIASQFTLTDMSMTARLEVVRAGMQILTRKNVITDMAIDEAVAALDCQGKLNASTVRSLMKEFRDALSEQGRHAPQAASSPLVTV